MNGDQNNRDSEQDGLLTDSEVRRLIGEMANLSARLDLMDKMLAAGQDSGPVVGGPISPEEPMEKTEDCHTTRGFVYPYDEATVAVTPLTWFRKYGDLASALTEAIGDPSHTFIVATRGASVVSVAAQASSPPGSDTNKWLLATLTYDEDDKLSDIKRDHVGDIFDKLDFPDHPFKFNQTAAATGTLTPGKCFINGIDVTITDLPATLSPSASTKYWVRVELYDEEASWESGPSGSGWPASDVDTEIWPILDLPVTDGQITDWVQHEWDNIHALYRPAVNPESYEELGSAAEGSETADTTAFTVGTDGKGLWLWFLSRIVYNHAGDKILYMMFRKAVIDKKGKIYSASAETRVEVDAAVPEN